MATQHTGLVNSERTNQQVCSSGADVMEDGWGFGISMTEFTSRRRAERIPVLEVEETVQPFQTAVTPLPLNAHLSYFADSTLKWHGSASAGERVPLSFTFVMSYSSALRHFVSVGLVLFY